MAKTSKKAKEFIAEKISKLEDEGYTNPKQRIAISYSMAEKKGLKIGKKKAPSKGKKS